MAEKTYVIIGNGMAGLSAAQAIRERDRAGRVVLIGDEGEPYYYRASLSEWISGDLTDALVLGRMPAFYNALHIEQVTAHVARIESGVRQIHLDDGSAWNYDKLLIATGARANGYPVVGLDEILVFRTWADARHIKERLGCCGRALILGGGILGLELAGALHRMGIERIAIVQRSGFVGGPLLDADAAAWLTARYLAPDGIDVFVNDTVTRVEGQTAYLQSGQTWDFDILVQAVGITPVFPETPGLTVGRGIRIDARCRTNLSDVYAAGDCTETQVPGSDGAADRAWQTTRIWLDCARQGRIAGYNMAGADCTLPVQPFYNASVIYTALYSVIGEPHSADGESYVWQSGNGYRKIRIVEGKLAGALLLNARRGDMALFKAIGQPVGDFRAVLARPDFPWNDLTGQDWDYEYL
ncbi:MAG: FAD-dependent oxidoreductase [Anaerolineae bacterium]|jgi:nitrite reductase (NADH) large subunit|nr:FAD-dependent oxidoreductase [Anaerolineae bacterium]